MKTCQSYINSGLIYWKASLIPDNSPNVITCLFMLLCQYVEDVSQIIVYQEAPDVTTTTSSGWYYRQPLGIIRRPRCVISRPDCWSPVHIIMWINTARLRHFAQEKLTKKTSNRVGLWALYLLYLWSFVFLTISCLSSVKRHCNRSYHFSIMSSIFEGKNILIV